jgi:hypothetical protein
MRYLVVRTDVHHCGPAELDEAISAGQPVRDERTSPEPRRQTATADDFESALRLARALSAGGAVRNGRQRVKVLRLGS